MDLLNQNMETNQTGEIIKVNNSEPFVGITEILGFSDSISNESENLFYKKRFRWSSNNISWSGWVDMNNDTFSKIKPKGGDLYLEIEYEHSGEGKLILSSIKPSVIYKNRESKETSLKSFCNCNLIGENCIENPSIIIDKTGLSNLSFNPYNQSRQKIQQWKELSEIVFNMWGHDVQYHKVNATDADHVMHTQSTFKEDKVCTIKVLPPRNQFPENNFLYSHWGAEIPEIFEVHISIKQFEEVFGKGSRPQDKDFLYFPLMNMNWRVEGSMVEKKLMQDAAFFRVSLTQYTKDTAIDLLEDTEDFLDEVMTTPEQFDNDVEKEIEDVTKPKQYKVVGNNDNDHIREYLNPEMDICDIKFYNGDTIVFKQFYALNNLTKQETAVTYRLPVEMKEGENLSFSFWMNLQYDNIPEPLLIQSKSPNGDNTLIKTTNDHFLKENDIIYIDGFSDTRGLYKVLKTPTTDTLIVNADYTRIGSNIEPQYETQMITNERLNISVFQKGIRVIVNDIDEIIESNFIHNEWYGIVINLSSQFCQISGYVWQVFNENMQIIASDVKDVKDFTIPYLQVNTMGGGAYISNIRAYKEILEPEVQENVISQYTIRDESLLWFADNCQHQVNLLKMRNR